MKVACFGTGKLHFSTISFLAKPTEANDVGCKSSVNYNIYVVTQQTLSLLLKLKLRWS